MELFFVTKINGGFFVEDYAGGVLVGYRSRKLAEEFATGASKGLFTEAEERNIRFDYIRAYLAARAVRVAPVSAQMELF